MSGIEAAQLVRTMRRHLRMAAVARTVLLTIMLAGFMAAIVWPAPGAAGDRLWTAAMFAAFGWFSLALFSARQLRATNQATMYISTGRLDLAEEQLKNALRIVSLYRTGKLLVCHNLAVVAHGQRNYGAAAELCDGLIASGVGASRGLGRMCRILLADCRLFLGQTAAAIRAIAPMRSDDPDLTLSERLMLLPIELRCQLSDGRYADAANDLPQKVRLAELLDAPKAALAHALLARACEAVGQAVHAAFLMRRAALYHDLEELRTEYPVLQNSPITAPGADNHTTN